MCIACYCHECASRGRINVGEINDEERFNLHVDRIIRQLGRCVCSLVIGSIGTPANELGLDMIHVLNALTAAIDALIPINNKYGTPTSNAADTILSGVLLDLLSAIPPAYETTVAPGCILGWLLDELSKSAQSYLSKPSDKVNTTIHCLGNAAHVLENKGYSWFRKANPISTTVLLKSLSPDITLHAIQIDDPTCSALTTPLRNWSNKEFNRPEASFTLIETILSRVDTDTAKAYGLIFLTLDSLARINTTKADAVAKTVAEQWLNLGPNASMADSVCAKAGISDRFGFMTDFLCDGMNVDETTFEAEMHKKASREFALQLLCEICLCTTDASVIISNMGTMIMRLIQGLTRPFVEKLISTVLNRYTGNMQLLLFACRSVLDPTSAEFMHQLPRLTSPNCTVADFTQLVYALRPSSVDEIIESFILKCYPDPLFRAIHYKRSSILELGEIVDASMQKFVKTFCALHSLKAACCRVVLYMASNPKCSIPYLTFNRRGVGVDNIASTVYNYTARDSSAVMRIFGSILRDLDSVYRDEGNRLMGIVDTY